MTDTFLLHPDRNLRRSRGLKLRFLPESGQYGELETGPTALALTVTTTCHVFEPNRTSAKAAGVEVALVVDDVTVAFRKALAAGATSVVEPVDKPWGQTIAYVRDLNGFLVELCTVVSD